MNLSDKGKKRGEKDKLFTNVIGQSPTISIEKNKERRILEVFYKKISFQRLIMQANKYWSNFFTSNSTFKLSVSNQMTRRKVSFIFLDFQFSIFVQTAPCSTKNTQMLGKDIQQRAPVKKRTPISTLREPIQSD